MLKLVFIYGPSIKAKECVTRTKWDDLVNEAEKRRMGVEDVKQMPWNEVKKTVTWWHKRYHKNAKGNVEKLWENISTDATSFWRTRYLK